MQRPSFRNVWYFLWWSGWGTLSQTKICFPIRYVHYISAHNERKIWFVPSLLTLKFDATVNIYVVVFDWYITRVWFKRIVMPYIRVSVNGVLGKALGQRWYWISTIHVTKTIYIRLTILTPIGICITFCCRQINCIYMLTLFNLHVCSLSYIDKCIYIYIMLHKLGVM